METDRVSIWQKRCRRTEKEFLLPLGIVGSLAPHDCGQMSGIQMDRFNVRDLPQRLRPGAGGDR